MNYLTNIKNTQKATRAEIDLGIAGDKASWHARFAHSAYVFAGGLPFELTEGDVLAVFSQYGEIVDLHLVRDKQTAKSRGFAFLAYEDQRSTVLAVDNLSGARVAGRTVRVEHVDNYRKKRAEVEGEPEPSSTPHAEEEQREERRQQAAQRAREAPSAGGGGGFGREDEGRGAVESGDGKGGGGGSVAEVLQEARRKGLANWQAMLAAGGGGGGGAAAMLDEGQVERRRERGGGRREKGKDKGVHRHHDRGGGREKKDKRDAKHKRSRKDKKSERKRSRSASPRRRRSRSR